MVAPSRWLISHKKSFIANQRGAVAFETVIVYAFMIIFLLLPLADLAIAGFQFVSARTSGEYESGIRSHGGERESPRAWIATGNRLVG